MIEKYNNWEWNYGYSPNYSFEKLSNFPGGAFLDVKLKIEKGFIQKIDLDGNCIKFEAINSFEKHLLYTNHNKSAVLKVVKELNLDDYFNKLDANQLISALF